MKQSLRVVIAAFALLLLVAGTAFATRSSVADQHRSPQAASHEPSSPEADADESPAEEPKSEASPDEAGGAALTDDHAAALVDLLKAQGIDATTDELKTLASTYGVGGAMRIEAWAAATNQSVDDLVSAYEASGVGWGAFAKQLESQDSSLHLSPGIGWIMGHGHGNANAHAADAPGQAKKSG